MNPPQRLHFCSSESPEARAACAALEARYPPAPLEEAEVIVAIGGDGAMLHALHRYLERPLPVYGMNRGHLGFLMNAFHLDELPARIARAEEVTISPLHMRVTDVGGHEKEGFAINEVALLRQTNQAAKLQIDVDGIERLEEIICDGVMVATPAGSTAYNLSAHGPILPLGASLVALTPISPFRPRRWRGALLRDQSRVTIKVHAPERRPVSASADFFEVRDVTQVEIRVAHERACRLLFDREEGFEERTIREQFSS